MCAEKTADSLTLHDKIIDAAMTLAVEQGWDYTTLRDIAARAGMDAVQLFDIVNDKNDVLMLLGRMIDHKVIENVTVSNDEGILDVRERLFDLLMDRYEILNDYRDGLRAIFESFRYDPKQMIISCPHLCRSMNTMLEFSGINTSGIKGDLKVAGLSAIYLKGVKTWMDDDSPDLSKTMAYLDKMLDRAEKVAGTFGL